MQARPLHTLWCTLTPIQRALLQRVARNGALERMMPWEGRTVRSLVARELLRRGGIHGANGWILTAKGRRVVSDANAMIEKAEAPSQS